MVRLNGSRFAPDGHWNRRAARLSAGSAVQLVAKEGAYASVKMPSSEIRKIFSECYATIGQVGNLDHENVSVGKAGRSRWLGQRPHVRGVAMLTAAQAGLAVIAYSPLSIKSAVVGYGRAQKAQVQLMVARLLGLPAPPEPPDVADALAIAICHLHTAATLQRQSVAAK